MLAMRKCMFGLRLLRRLRHVMDDLVYFFRRQRRRLLAANEARDLWRRLDQVPSLLADFAMFVGFNLDQNIAWKDHARGFDALRAAHLDDRLGWHEHLRDLIPHV